MKKFLLFFLLFGTISAKGYLSGPSTGSRPTTSTTAGKAGRAKTEGKIIGSVTFSWDKIGDTTLVITYMGEQLHPMAEWHKHAGGYTSKQAKKAQNKLINRAKLVNGTLYRKNEITFTWWDYLKSFFVKPAVVKTQTYVLFSDGSEKTSGLVGQIKEWFIKESRNILGLFNQLRQVRNT